MTGRRAALIIATSDYEDSNLHKLAAPLEDALALSEVLADPAVGGFEVEVVRDEPAHRIRERVERFFADRHPDDLLVVHFSCHGLKDTSGELHLAARNTTPTMLGSTAVDATFVSRLMRRSRARRAVLSLDCCYGGAFERGLVPRSTGEVDVGGQFDQQNLGGGRGRVVMTAASAVEYAFEANGLVTSSGPRPSLYTGAFAEGLATGEADRDQDGYVSLEELYEHIHDRVREQTPHQTPSKWEFGMQGELVIARNPMRVVRSTPLPDELRTLMGHPVAASRLGLAHELGRLAAGDDLSLAAAAREALQQLVDDDSRRVSSLVTELLEDTRLELERNRIDLGTHRVGTAAPTGSVAVRGVPLAQVSRVSASGPGLRAYRVDDELRIELDTSTPRRIDTTVTVDGPAGQAELTVVAQVVAAERTTPGSAATEPTTLEPAAASAATKALAAEPAAGPAEAVPAPGTVEDKPAKSILDTDGRMPGPRQRLVQALRRPGARSGWLPVATLAGVALVLIWGVALHWTLSHPEPRQDLRLASALLVVVLALAGLWLDRDLLVFTAGVVGVAGFALWAWVTVAAEDHGTDDVFSWIHDGRINLPALAGMLLVLGAGWLATRRGRHPT